MWGSSRLNTANTEQTFYLPISLDSTRIYPKITNNTILEPVRVNSLVTTSFICISADNGNFWWNI